MMMLEHEGKQCLPRPVCPYPREKCSVPESPSMEEEWDGISTFPVAVKAQVRSGGRGKQGGVRQVKAAAEWPARGQSASRTLRR